MFCPNCGHKQLCGCSSCKNYNMATWRWTSDGNAIMCAGCGLTMSADWWENLEMEIVAGIESNKKANAKANHFPNEIKVRIKT
jgi:hypothetical protein